jgi:16S rRNA G966 N2-methylase RsmD
MNHRTAPGLVRDSIIGYLAAAVLPLGRGVILDPFAGSGSTLAAANAIGRDSIGIEKDARYATLARRAISGLSQVVIKRMDPIGA